MFVFEIISNLDRRSKDEVRRVDPQGGGGLWGKGARRIFSRSGQIRGLGTKVLQRRPGMEPKWGVWGGAPRSRRQVVKIMPK